MSAASSTTPQLPLHLGCPVWKCESWAGIVYPEKTPTTQWLLWYSRMFNVVEGNSTFYAIPSEATVQRWVENSAEGFKFCMKFPREISHERCLVNAQDATDRFVAVLEILDEGKRLGPSFLQLGPSFSPNRANDLARYLDQLPDSLPWCVEVRHRDWFDSGNHEKLLNQMLSDRGINKVLFDSRPLFASTADDEIEARAMERKPKTPVRQTVTGKRPLVRLIGRNQTQKIDAYLDQWVAIVTGWLQQGLQPYFFTHAPDDRFAPELARRFWHKLAASIEGAMPELPVPSKPAKQMNLTLE